MIAVVITTRIEETNEDDIVTTGSMLYTVFIFWGILFLQLTLQMIRLQLPSTKKRNYFTMIMNLSASTLEFMLLPGSLSRWAKTQVYKRRRKATTRFTIKIHIHQIYENVHYQCQRTTTICRHYWRNFCVVPMYPYWLSSTYNYCYITCNNWYASIPILTCNIPIINCWKARALFVQLDGSFLTRENG